MQRLQGSSRSVLLGEMQALNIEPVRMLSRTRRGFAQKTHPGQTRDRCAIRQFQFYESTDLRDCVKAGVRRSGTKAFRYRLPEETSVQWASQTADW
jgi:hypothetical protein